MPLIMASTLAQLQGSARTPLGPIFHFICVQGDSGGPLYIFDKKKKEAVLVGVVNRGSGCARRDALGIYARVKFHMKWIKELADSGRC